MAADAIELYLDTSTPQGAIWSGLSDKSPLALGPFYQGALLKLRVFPVIPIPTNNAVGPFFSQLSLANLDLQAAIGPAAGAEALYAFQLAWAKQLFPDGDGKSGYFYADLNLNTNELNAALGSAPSLLTQFEFELSRAGSGFAPVFQTDILVKAAVKGPASAAAIPVPADKYLTRDECLNLFVMWNNQLRPENAGRAAILVSPNSAHTREIGVDDAGNPTDNLT